VDWPEFEKLRLVVGEFTGRDRDPENTTWGEAMQSEGFVEALARVVNDPERLRRLRKHEVDRYFCSWGKFSVGARTALPHLVRYAQHQPYSGGPYPVAGFTPRTLAHRAIEGGLTERKAANRAKRFEEAAIRMGRLAELLDARRQEETTIRRLK